MKAQTAAYVSRIPHCVGMTTKVPGKGLLLVAQPERTLMAASDAASVNGPLPAALKMVPVAGVASLSSPAKVVSLELEPRTITEGGHVRPASELMLVKAV